MGLLDDIGATVKPPAGWQRQAFKLAMREPFASLIATWTRSIDEAVFRITRGTTTMTGQISGLPVIWLKSIGAKSGIERRTPLLGVPTADGDLAVLGTNFGKVDTPGWVHNLHANPSAAVEYRGKAVDVAARVMGHHEVDAVWDTASSSTPSFAKYRAEISNRDVMVFELKAV